MKLYIRIEGSSTEMAKIEIAQNSLPILKKHGIRLDGGFSFNNESGISFIRVDQYKAVFRISGDLSMWIFGLNQNKWFGDKVHQLEADLEAATGVPAICVINK